MNSWRSISWTPARRFYEKWHAKRRNKCIDCGRNNSYLSNMGKIEKISIALPQDLIADVKAAVEQGDYSTTSEVIREALRDWKTKRKIEALDVADLRRLVQE